MMTTPAAIKATFSDFKIVRGRKCAQLVFEIPLELADASLAALGGLPQAATERWFGIARLDPKKIEQAPAHDKDRRVFSEMPLPQQIGIRCNEPAFRGFIEIRKDIPIQRMERMADECADYVRKYCEVTSRSEIRPGSFAAKRWKELDDGFYFWLRGDQ